MTQPFPDQVSEAALTDDEVVALANRAKRPWRSVLLTVNPGDPQDLRRAVARGERSLFARGLVPGQAASTALDRVLAFTLAGDQWVSAFTADRDLRFDPAGFTYLNYGLPGDPEVLLEVVTPIGLHRFGTVPVADSADVLRQLVAGIVEGEDSSVPGAEPIADTLVLAFRGDTPQTRRVFTVRPGRVEAAVVVLAQLTGADRTALPLRPADVADVVAVVDEVYGS
jgi:hypothetical protein